MSAMPKPLPDVASATAISPRSDNGNYCLPLPRRAMTEQEKLLALSRLQAQAEHRVKLGVQLFKATEAYSVQQQTMLKDFKAQQETLRQEMQQEMTQSLRSYDQWIGQVENATDQKLDEMTRRLEKIEADWRRTETRLETTLKRVEALLEQSRTMLDRPLVPDFLPDETEPAQASFMADSPYANVSRPSSAGSDELIDTGQLYAQMVQRLKAAPAAAPIDSPVHEHSSDGQSPADMK